MQQSKGVNTQLLELRRPTQNKVAVAQVDLLASLGEFSHACSIEKIRSNFLLFVLIVPLIDLL
jgi:hypothetical protein